MTLEKAGCTIRSKAREPFCTVPLPFLFWESRLSMRRYSRDGFFRRVREDGAASHRAEAAALAAASHESPYQTIRLRYAGNQVIKEERKMKDQDRLKDHMNTGHVKIYPVASDRADELQHLLQQHLQATGSNKAKEILSHFDAYLPGFKAVISDEYLSFLKARG